MKIKNWNELAEKAISGQELTRPEAVAVLRSADEDILAVLHAAFQVRQHFFGRKVRLNMLLNAKSGHCADDCGYCSQSRRSKAKIPEYPLVDREELVAGAHRAEAHQAGTYCMVCSGHSPSERDLEIILDAVREIKATTHLRVCVSLGILREGQAARLREAGVDRYNHNINTSARYYPKIASAHGYNDRVATVKEIKANGISSCSGVIIGMGESPEDVVEMAFALRELAPESIPVNFFHPIPGTPLGHLPGPTPYECLRALALFRFVCPDIEIRAAGGREDNLRTLQPLAFFAATSLFVGGYLTTDGQEPDSDYRMLRDLGFEIEKTQAGSH